MATRSHIGKKQADGSVKYIYCHWDGYPEHNGEILKRHYADEAKVDSLLSLGDISVLGREIGGEQDFERRETHNPNWCLAYGRDRGEKDVKAQIAASVEDYSNPDWVDYCYLFENGEWHCFKYKEELVF